MLLTEPLFLSPKMLFSKKKSDCTPLRADYSTRKPLDVDTLRPPTATLLRTIQRWDSAPS